MSACFLYVHLLLTLSKSLISSSISSTLPLKYSSLLILTLSCFRVIWFSKTAITVSRVILESRRTFLSFWYILISYKASLNLSIPSSLIYKTEKPFHICLFSFFWNNFIFMCILYKQENQGVLLHIKNKRRQYGFRIQK